MNQLYCSIRKIWVKASPEETIRQATILQLQQLGFPISCIGIEKELKTLVPFHTEHCPDRRLDLICYAKESHQGMTPLLLVECKAVAISSRELQQVIGYNYYVKAPFISLVNQQEKRVGWYDPQLKDYKFVNYLPTYSELIKSILIS